MSIWPGLNQYGGVGMQAPLSFLVFLINIRDVILSNEIIFHYGLPQIDLWTCMFWALEARPMSLTFLKMPSIFYPNNKHEKGWLHGICMVVIK